MYSVYKHTSPSGKVYIGVTSQKPELRWRNGRGYSDNEYFTRAIKKYGWDNFKHEVLIDGLTKEEAEVKEVELISFYKSNNRTFGYNIENGGSLSGKHSEYTRLKMSNSQKGEKNHRFGKKFPNQRYGRYGNISEEERLNRSLAHKNQVPVNKKKVAQYSKDGCFIMKFDSFSQASQVTKIALSNIARCANGDRKTAGGYMWKLIDC